MLPTLGEERRATYSPFLPISPKTGRVLQVPTLERNVEKGTIVFDDEDGELHRGPGHRRPCEAAVAARLGHALDRAGASTTRCRGKDLIDSRRGVSNQICQALGGAPPEGFHYELFMDENNQKISKSKGNGLTMEEWLRYGTPESLAYYMFQSPEVGQAALFRRHPQGDRRVSAAARRLSARRRGAAPSRSTTRPGTSTRGAPPKHGSPVSLLAAAEPGLGGQRLEQGPACGASSPATCPARRPQSEPLLDRLAGYAINYYEDFVKPTKPFRAPDDAGARGACWTWPAA